MATSRAARRRRAPSARTTTRPPGGRCAPAGRTPCWCAPTRRRCRRPGRRGARRRSRRRPSRGGSSSARRSRRGRCGCRGSWGRWGGSWGGRWRCRARSRLLSFFLVVGVVGVVVVAVSVDGVCWRLQQHGRQRQGGRNRTVHHHLIISLTVVGLEGLHGVGPSVAAGPGAHWDGDAILGVGRGLLLFQLFGCLVVCCRGVLFCVRLGRPVVFLSTAVCASSAAALFLFLFPFLCRPSLVLQTSLARLTCSKRCTAAACSGARSLALARILPSSMAPT